MAYSKIELEAFIERALEEDLGEGDHTSLSTIPQGTESRAQLIVKENGVLAGVDLALEIYKKVDSSLKIELFKKG